MLASGSHLAEGKTVPTGQVFAGAPAKYLRDTTTEEKHMISEYMQEQQQLSQIYAEETEKDDFREILNDRDAFLVDVVSGPADLALKSLDEQGIPIITDDFEYAEHRIFSQTNLGPEHDERHTDQEINLNNKGWNPYEQDLQNYPEVFKMYGENFDRYEKAKKFFEEDDSFEQPGKNTPHEQRIPKNQDPWTKKYDDFMPRYDGSSHV